MDDKAGLERFLRTALEPAGPPGAVERDDRPRRRIHGIPDIIELAGERESDFGALEVIHGSIDIVADIGGFGAGWIGG
jgi:hypothetical protein